MKSLLYTFLLTISFHFLLAQNYDPFPTDNAVWDVVFDEFTFDSIATNFKIKYQLNGDTVLNGEVFSKMYFQKILEVTINQFTNEVDTTFLNELPVLMGFIKEDLPTKRVYFRQYRDEGWPEVDPCVEYLVPDPELLLYDFSAEQDDTIQYLNLPFWVDTMYTKTYADGITRNTQALLAETYWWNANSAMTEGIGSAGGPLGLYQIGYYEGGCLLQCFAKDGYLIDGDFSICNEYMPVNTDDPAGDPFRIAFFPNPFQERLNLVFPALDDSRTYVLTISDFSGKVCFVRKDLTGGENHFDVSHLPPGIYVSNLSQNGRQLHSKKLIKF